MALFSGKKTKKADAPDTSKKNAATEEATTLETSAPVAVQAAGMTIRPRVSEKASISSTRGAYVFDVPLNANKVEIAKAVASAYKVKVESVRTVRGIGKIVRRGRIVGKRSDWKKAIVQLKKGQTITLA